MRSFFGRLIVRRGIALRIFAAAVLLAIIPTVFADVKHFSLDDVRIVAVHEHNEASFTEGYFFNGDIICESGGYWGESAYYENNERKIKLSRTVFGEGAVMLGGKLFILTYQNKLAYIYDAATLKFKTLAQYPREGWGLTTDGTYLIASDGSSNLYFMDTEYRLKKTLSVTSDGKAVPRINELEYINGDIWANIFVSDDIIVIDSATGKVRARIDFSKLYPEEKRNKKADVMNGIAWNEKTKTLWLTGKYWDKAFEVDVSRIMKELP